MITSAGAQGTKLETARCNVAACRFQLALGAAFVVLIGAVVAFVLHARVVGIVLLVLMLLGGMASFYFSVQFRNRAVAQARAARQEQAARAAGNRKASRPSRD